MSGFNRINQTQLTRPVMAPLGVRNHNIENQRQHTNIGSTPLKRSAPLVETFTPAKRNQLQTIPSDRGFNTPSNRENARLDLTSVHNAPIKKRSTENTRHQQGNSFTDGVIIESPSLIMDQSQDFEVDDFPANQQGLYDDGFDLPSQVNDNHVIEKNGRVAFERVKEETVEMGGFILPGAEKKQIHKSYNWIAGRSDGQYRVVLGYNTLFKPKTKNGIDVATGEKDESTARWRVVRFENRYKENYPYTEFPAKYLSPLIQALDKARETYEEEMKEESVL